MSAASLQKRNELHMTVQSLVDLLSSNPAAFTVFSTLSQLVSSSSSSSTDAPPLESSEIKSEVKSEGEEESTKRKFTERECVCSRPV